MDEAKIQRQAQRAKTWNIIIFSLFATVAISALIGFCVFRYQHTFTVDKWFKAPNDRTNIVADMLEKHELVGMTEVEIISLLGKEESRANTQTTFKISKASFDPENTIVYYLGVDFMELRWLIISLQDGIVSSYCIDVT